MPDAVHGGTREIRVLRRRHPVSESNAAVFLRPEAGRFAAQKLGCHGLLRHRVFDFPLVCEIPGSAVFRGTMFHLKPCEERRKTVEIILCEVFQWMIVTLGAFHPNAKEQPGNGGSRFLHIELLQHEVRGRMPEISGGLLKRVTLAGDQIADHLIVRPVSSEPVGQPLLEFRHGSPLRVELVVAKPVLKLHGPKAGVLRAFQQ